MSNTSDGGVSVIQLQCCRNSRIMCERVKCSKDPRECYLQTENACVALLTTVGGLYCELLKLSSAVRNAQVSTAELFEANTHSQYFVVIPSRT